MRANLYVLPNTRIGATRLARKPLPPADACPYCDQGTSLQVSIAARHGRSALLRSMWCASCRGTYLAIRRLLPEVSVADSRRRRPVTRFDAEKLRRSVTQPVRKIPADGFRDPFTRERLVSPLGELASEFVLDFAVEELSRAAGEPNGEVTTDQVAEVTMAAMHRMHPLAYLRSAVHHRLFPACASHEECEELANIADELLHGQHVHTRRIESDLPALREPPPPMLCPRCGTQKVSRRSRSRTVRDLEQQPASCSHCGQRYIWEWGSQVPLLVSSEEGDSLFDLARFRTGIRSAVRKLPGPAAIWTDEKLVASAANTALARATPYIRPPEPGRPVPSVHADDLWLAAASALRGIHPLAFVRYAIHSGALAGLEWSAAQNTRLLARMDGNVQEIAGRYFASNTFERLTR